MSHYVPDEREEALFSSLAGIARAAGRPTLTQVPEEARYVAWRSLEDDEDRAGVVLGLALSLSTSAYEPPEPAFLVAPFTVHALAEPVWLGGPGLERAFFGSYREEAETALTFAFVVEDVEEGARERREARDAEQQDY